MNVSKAVYEKMDLEKLKEAVKHDEWRLHYHLMPPTGWLNDPNGLCQFHGVYHIYYQYSPEDVEGKTKLWGHYTSKDFIHFKECEPVLFEDSKWDERGVYSGSAFVKDDTIHFFYTGNVKLEGDYDFINTGREQNTIHVSSKDGFQISEKKLRLTNRDYPEDMSCHVRDPKIIEYNNTYYMVLGARDIHSKGCVLVYKSQDLEDWTYAFRIETKDKFGYMWECPDLFELDGKYFLFTCPQGLKQDGIKYESIYQNGYFPIDIDFEKGTYTLHEFEELDYGFDFYAPQSFLDESDRRILIGWMGLPDIDYTNPTTEKGWQHALALPRQLRVKNNKIIQEPLEELKALRCEKITCPLDEWNKQDIGSCFELNVQFKQEQSFALSLREDMTVSYDTATHVFTLKLGDSGYGRDARHVYIQDLRDVTIYSDTSSIEIFLNHGEKSMTSRIYDHMKFNLELNSIETCEIICYKLNSYIVE